MIFKLELSPQNFHYDVLYPLYSDLICILILYLLSFVYWQKYRIEIFRSFKFKFKEYFNCVHLDRKRNINCLNLLKEFFRASCFHLRPIRRTVSVLPCLAHRINSCTFSTERLRLQGPFINDVVSNFNFCIKFSKFWQYIFPIP